MLKSLSAMFLMDIFFFNVYSPFFESILNLKIIKSSLKTHLHCFSKLVYHLQKRSETKTICKLTLYTILKK